MTVTISPTLEGKIERRSRRAFRRFDEEDKARIHRISSVTERSLKYRIPRSGRKQVEVVRDDNGAILVDPPTTDARDLLKTVDIGKLKNNTGKLHQGEITGYILVEKVKKVGKTYKKTAGVFPAAEASIKNKEAIVEATSRASATTRAKQPPTSSRSNSTP